MKNNTFDYGFSFSSEWSDVRMVCSQLLKVLGLLEEAVCVSPPLAPKDTLHGTAGNGQGALPSCRERERIGQALLAPSSHTGLGPEKSQ